MLALAPQPFIVAGAGGAGSNVADWLGTTGADVNVGNAAPPVAGQVLKATSPTTATWLPDSGVSNPLILATGDAVVTAPAGQASAGIGHGAGGGVGTGEVQVNGVDNGMAMGWVQPGGAADVCRIRVSSEGGFAFGSAAGQGNGYTALIEAGGQYGNFAWGRVYPYNGGNCSILTSNDASMAAGYAGGYPANIYSFGIGSFAMGNSYGVPTRNGLIRAGGNGDFAQGNAFGGTIRAAQGGAFAQGTAWYGGYIQATQRGAVAQGYAAGDSSEEAYIEATAKGARATGYAHGDINNAYIRATAPGAVAGGRATDGTIEATGEGASAFGRVSSYAGGSSTVRASGLGSCAHGLVQLGGAFTGLIEAEARGSQAFGDVRGWGANASIKTEAFNGYGSIAHGYAGAGNATADILADGWG